MRLQTRANAQLLMWHIRLTQNILAISHIDFVQYRKMGNQDGMHIDEQSLHYWSLYQIILMRVIHAFARHI